MEKLKKSLVIVSLATLGIACAMLIAGIFGLKVFSDPIILKILLTVSTISVTAGVSINEISVIKRKKILGFIGLALLLASATLAIILFIVPTLFSNSTMVKTTSIVAVTSLVFITIISNYSKLESSMIGLQIFAYIVFIAVDIIISLLIAGVNVFAVPGMPQMFGVLCICAVGLMIALSVLSSKRKATAITTEKHATIKVEDDKILISKAEYYTLKEENQKLKEQKIDEDKIIISKAEYYSLKEDNLKMKEELLKLKQPE